MTNFLKMLCLAVSIVAALVTGPALSAFDPANDDTDLFLANPNAASERPNVLIILDNTANWNSAFTNEKAALVNVVNGLSDAYNVGLMMFPETGAGNDSVDGGYVKFGMRQMTSANKGVLANIVSGLNQLADKGNNATTGLALHEAYLYFRGTTAVAGHGKVKRDYAGNTANNPLAANLPGNAFADGSTQVYSSAISNNCQKNFIIYISNGSANENASARSDLQAKLTALKGGTAPAVIAINPSGQQGNWADEMAQFMATIDLSNTAAGTQNIITYTVEVDRVTTGGGPDMTALMQSVASNGLGKYFSVTSAGSGTAILDALNQIFSEIQAVNSVYAASTLPVSANVRGVNLNQVYVGVFRPDATRSPRWFGNLKMYQFALDPATGAPFLADANKVAASNAATGFISNSAVSLWTSTSSYWAYRTPYAAGDIGGASDMPDGDLVEKGGAAHRLRSKFSLAEGASPKRSLYTCTSGAFFNCAPECVDGVCTSGNGAALSSTPFSTANTDITAASFLLGSNPVSPLTAALSQNVTSVQGSLPITSMTNSLTPVTVTLGNGVTAKTVSGIVNSASRTVTLANGTVARSIGAASYVGGGTKQATFTTSAAHGFGAGQSVTVVGGGGNSNYDGTYAILASPAPTATTFVVSANLGSPGTLSSGTINSTTTTVTATASAAHGFTAGQPVVIGGSANTAYNGTFSIVSVPATTTFTFTLSSPQPANPAGSITAASGILTASATSIAHGFSNGATVTVSGASVSGWNGVVTISNAVANSFDYALAALPTGAASAAAGVTSITASVAGSTTVTATSTAAHGFANGSTVTIAGATPAGYNGSYVIANVNGPGTTFQFSTASAMGAASGSISASGPGTTTVTLQTGIPHGLAVAGNFVVSGAASSSYNQTWAVATVPTATSLTFTTPTVLGAPGGTPLLTGPAGGARVWAVTPAAHGYANGTNVTIANAASPYNGSFAVTSVNGTTFTYPLGAQIGANTSSATVTASIPSTTAVATSINHGLVSGGTVVISGAAPAAFNGSFAVTVTDASTFTYPLGSAQLAASGSIYLSSGGSGSGRDNLINWVRGANNAGDEGTSAAVRPSIHGDVLHAQPLVVNYNRYGDDNDVVVYYGSNDGVVHALKGGIPAAAGVDSDPYGNELWGFVPSEFFPTLNRLRNNSPKVSSSFKRPYFADGSVAAYTKDADGNGKLGDSGDRAYIYVPFRRGGRMLYSLDVSAPVTPLFRWKIDQGTTHFSELGHTWSKPAVLSAIVGEANPVLLFGGGHDPAVEDLDPLTVATNGATVVNKTDGTSVARTMGRAIYMVDAVTGRQIWRAAPGSTAGCTAGSATTPAICTVPGLDYAIPSDVLVMRNPDGGAPKRAYVGDTGGNLWRIDFGGTDKSLWKVTKLASVADPLLPSGRRKFLFPPDIVSYEGFDAVVIGSGDRDHPFDTSVVNRMYMFKDKGSNSGPLTGTTGSGGAYPTLTTASLFDQTANCIQDASACVSPQTSATAITALSAAAGWYITLGTGEKVVGSSLALYGTIYFGTNQPDVASASSGGSCGSNLGIARRYQVSVLAGTATSDLNGINGVTGADRSVKLPGGGLPPSPTFGLVNIPNATGGTTTVQVVGQGTQFTQVTGAPLGQRLRKFWYKEIDE